MENFKERQLANAKRQIGAKLRCTFDNHLTVKTYTYLRFSGVSIVKKLVKSVNYYRKLPSEH